MFGSDIDAALGTGTTIQTYFSSNALYEMCEQLGWDSAEKSWNFFNKYDANHNPTYIDTGDAKFVTKAVTTWFKNLFQSEASETKSRLSMFS